MLFLKTRKVMQSDYMTKNKKAYIAYNAYTKKMYALQKKNVRIPGRFRPFHEHLRPFYERFRSFHDILMRLWYFFIVYYIREGPKRQ